MIFFNCNVDASEELIIKEDELIPREIIFSNPDRGMVRISEDGKYLSYLSPKDGVLNVWVAPINNLKSAKIITDEKERNIAGYYWAKDSEHIIYMQDEKGDENYRTYSVNIETLNKKLLTPPNGVKTAAIHLSKRFPQHVLVAINERISEYFDFYKVDIKTGKRDLIYENKNEFSHVVFNDDFKPRVGYKMLTSGEGEVYLLGNDDLTKPVLLQTIPVEDMLTTELLHITSDGEKLFLKDSINRNTSALIEYSFSSNQYREIFSNPKVDVNNYISHPKTGMIRAVATNYLRQEWTVIDEKIKHDFEFLQSVDNGDFEIVSCDYADNKWIIAFYTSDAPSKYYLYDRNNKTIEFLFHSNSKHEDLPFAKMYPVEIKSRDNLNLVSYLTIPRWLDNGSGKPIKPVPLLLNVHGGPNTRDHWTFYKGIQWLANRGYAVLNVNYRGSTGFGKDFVNAGNGEWAGKMQNDLEDAVDWAIASGITSKDKVGIIGGSYGGYATLVGLTKTPDKYALGVDIVGPSNLLTLFNSAPPYWKPYLVSLMKKMGGDPKTEEGRKIFLEKSPLTHVSKIKKPLIVVQGANDPRVKRAESDQVVSAMKERNLPVVYLLYPDEGHGLRRLENKLSMYAIIEPFLSQFLGGRVENAKDEIKASSVEIIEGKNIIEDLISSNKHIH